MNRALRVSAPIALAAAAALLLAGCTGNGPAPTPSPTAAGACVKVDPGAASKAVKVTGEFGKATKATFTAPLDVPALQRSVVISGNGAEASAGKEVNVVLSLFSAKTGKELISSPASLKVGDSGLLKGFDAAIGCVKLGSRTVTTAPAADVFGAKGNQQLGVAPGESLVIVADVMEFYVEPTTPPLPKPQTWTENVPDVKFDGDKPPTVTIPKATPSPDLLVKVLKDGNGAKVGENDTVTLQYQGRDWATGQVFDQSYGRDKATFPVKGVIPGFAAALVGQKVGTKLIVSIPPKDGYGTDAAKNQLGGKTLVFVVEILDTKAG